ncbi:hypothetical protein BJF79_34300 [Actinomadura sp. CNU-125]|uniref:hypothetical protein n=1 Tax=Actinomadura sp. CNU-125 TaxID=1904961 RepID=UPI0009673F24|nr:hypothetical protein [Actinomadura sp. CNU-125]OLT33644.1 hypothetical protein BJF79_34300 [Actinomadura sp. CNU-125]
MGDKVKAGTSVRWGAPTYTPEGEFWTALLRYRLTDRERAVGLEAAVFGPDVDACVRETVRQDREWCEFPLRSGDREGARERLRFLATGGGGAA